MTPDRSPSDADLLDALSERLERFELHAAGHLMRWIHEADLNFAELRVFLVLADGQARTGPDLAETTGLPAETVYPAMHKLEARGWLTEEERRHSLGGSGQQQLVELAGVRRAAVGDFIASLPADERRNLALALCGDGATGKMEEGAG